MKKRFIVALLLLMTLITQVGRFHQISAYFESKQIVSFNFRIGDWVAPDLTISKVTQDTLIDIQETIHNGNFDQEGEGWQEVGAVSFIAIDHTGLETSASKAAVLESHSGNMSKITQNISHHNPTYLQFFLRVESDETVTQFLEHSFQVVANNQVIYEWHPSRETLSNWHDIRARLPASTAEITLEFRLKPLTTITKPISVVMTGISTQTVGLTSNQFLKFESNEPASTLCLYQIHTTNPFECHSLPYERYFSATEKKNYKAVVSDPAGLNKQVFFSYQTDFSKPQSSEITTTYFENEGELTVGCLINTGTENELYQLFGFSAEPEGEYLWLTDIFDWKSAGQLNSTIHTILSLNDTCVTKIIKNIPITARWFKIRTVDRVGNEADVSNPYQIRD